MEERELRNNYIFTLAKLILFLIIFCFMVEVSIFFWKEVRSKNGFKVALLSFSSLALFCCYCFLADLNNAYKKVQRFFFRSAYVTYLFPSVLIVLSLSYFFLPKIFSLSFNRDIFVFLGGFAFTGHLVYIARETKGTTFTALVNYFFIFGILYIFNLLLLGLYLKIGFPIELGRIVVDGAQAGASLIQNIFTQFSS